MRYSLEEDKRVAYIPTEKFEYRMLFIDLIQLTILPLPLNL